VIGGITVQPKFSLDGIGRSNDLIPCGSTLLGPIEARVYLMVFGVMMIRFWINHRNRHDIEQAGAADERVPAEAHASLIVLAAELQAMRTLIA